MINRFVIISQSKAILLTEQSRYSTLFHLLLKHSPQARDALFLVAQAEIRKEAAKLKRREINISSMEITGGLTISSMTEFSWETLIAEMHRKCPWTTGMVDAAMPSPSAIRKHHRASKHKR